MAIEDDDPRAPSYLSIETEYGVIVRVLRPASLLPPDLEGGPGAEHATRSAAATWGLPDFVFKSRVRALGSGSRELGDCILVSGDRVAIVQVKHRGAPSGDPARERSWLDKNIQQGTRQAQGTAAALGSGAILTNERGRSTEIAVGARAPTLIVVVDHGGLSDYTPSARAVVLLRRDWEFLFEQLKSMYAVLEYLERVATLEPQPLGEEPMRYYELAAADLAAPMTPLDPRLAQFVAQSRSTPLLPQAPTGEGETAHLIIRSVLEDLAIAPTSLDERDRLDVLAAIDSLHVSRRAELGLLFRDWLREARAVPSHQRLWRFRSELSQGRPYLIFGATNLLDRESAWRFAEFVLLRHQQQVDLVRERADLTSVGVLLTPMPNEPRRLVTKMVAVRGDPVLGPKHRAAAELLWGAIGSSTIERRPDVASIIAAYTAVGDEDDEIAATQPGRRWRWSESGDETLLGDPDTRRSLVPADTDLPAERCGAGATPG